jgi:CRP-like cAMP-binding protein
VRGSPEIRVGEGDVVGEGCLLDEGQRQADVRAETPLMALRIEKEKLDDVTRRHPAIGDALFQLLARRLVMNLMHASPLFAAFEPRVRNSPRSPRRIRRPSRSSQRAPTSRSARASYRGSERSAGAAGATCRQRDACAFLASGARGETSKRSVARPVRKENA